MQPQYRIRVEIYDDEVGEVVSRNDQRFTDSEEENVALMYRALRAFTGDRTAHEITHYPDGIKDTIEF